VIRTNLSPTTITFEPFRLDLRAGRLLRGREPIALRPKTWSVLRYFVERPGQLITKDELLDAVWGDVSVTQSVLNKSIRELRVALGDSVKVPRLIETVQRRGFRFIAPVDVGPPIGSGRPLAATDSESAGPIPLTGKPLLLASDASALIPFVGRAKELQRLAELLAKACEGRRQIVFITGPAGIGKTTLVRAFLDSLAGHEASTYVRVARGFCVEQHGPREPYMPVLEALGRLASRTDAGRLGALLHRVAPTWLVQMPWLIGGDEAKALQQMLQFVRPERMVREFAVLMEELTNEMSLVLVLEDLHWSDASTIDLLSVLGERDEKARLLVIATYRPADAIVGEHPVSHAMRNLHMHRQCVELALSDLTAEDVRAYLQARFPGSDFPSALAPPIHRHTDGSPLFISSVVDSLLSRGSILDTAPGWALAIPAETLDLGMPDDVRLLIESQLDGLGPADQSLLQAASVAGEDFSPLVVAAALGREEADVESRCESFSRARRFLRPAGHVQWPDHRQSPRYAFSHELYRQVIYAKIGEGQCMRLHQRIGQALEEAHGARRLEIAPRLAIHFERGRDDERAVHYLVAAAAGACQRFANREAIAYLEAALAIVALGGDGDNRRPRELEVRLALGPALSEIEGFASDQVLRNYERASELCPVEGHAAPRLRIVYARWYVHAMRADRDQAIALAAELGTLARRRGTAQDRLLADFAMLRTALYDGRFLEARRWMHRIARQGTQQTISNPSVYGPDPLISAAGHSAIALWFLGHPERAQAMADGAVSRARGSGHVFTLAALLYQSALVHLLSRNVAQARRLAEEGASVSAEYGFPFWHATASMVLGAVLVQEGHVDDGTAAIERALSAIAVMGAKLLSATAHAFLAEGLMSAGVLVDALTAVDTGLELARTTLDRAYEPELWRLKGELLLRVDNQRPRSASRAAGAKLAKVGDGHGSLVPLDLEDAEPCFRRALAVARASASKSLELRAAISLARAWQGRGRIAHARRLLSSICGWFGGRAGGADLGEARALLSQLRNPDAAPRDGKRIRRSKRRPRPRRLR
jgi:DNA-binding winged helix-turn-helix (wHTH) protein/type II secretory pathway predicted ATPase ExeA/tetratricopeptide (TPR) repeat protein